MWGKKYFRIISHPRSVVVYLSLSRSLPSLSLPLSLPLSLSLSLWHIALQQLNLCGMLISSDASRRETLAACACARRFARSKTAFLYSASTCVLNDSILVTVYSTNKQSMRRSRPYAMSLVNSYYTSNLRMLVFNDRINPCACFAEYLKCKACAD